MWVFRCLVHQMLSLLLVGRLSKRSLTTRTDESGWDSSIRSKDETMRYKKLNKAPVCVRKGVWAPLVEMCFYITEVPDLCECEALHFLWSGWALSKQPLGEHAGITGAHYHSDILLNRAGLSHVSVSLCSPASLSVCHLASFRSLGSKLAFSSAPAFKLQTGNVDMNDNQRRARCSRREKPACTHICVRLHLKVLQRVTLIMLFHNLFLVWMNPFPGGRGGGGIRAKHNACACWGGWNESLLRHESFIKFTIIATSGPELLELN